MNFAVIDVIFTLLILLFLIRCYLKGFISEIFPMAGIVLGLLASLYFFKNGAVFIKEKFMPETAVIPEVMAFIIIFLVVFLFFKIIEIMLSDIIYRVSLDSADRFLGVIFGLAEGIAVVSLILFLLKVQPLFDPEPILSDSIFAKFLLPLITGREKVSV